MRVTVWARRAAPPKETFKLDSWGSLVAKLKLKGIDGKAPPGVELAAQFDSTREISPDPNVYDDRQTESFFLI